MRYLLSLLLTVMVVTSTAFAQRRGFPHEGVELSAEQQEQVEEVRAKFADQVRTLQRELREIYAPEQLQARRKAFQQARNENKDPREAQRLAKAAGKFTAEQPHRIDAARAVRSAHRRATARSAPRSADARPTCRSHARQREIRTARAERDGRLAGRE